MRCRAVRVAGTLAGIALVAIACGNHQANPGAFGASKQATPVRVASVVEQAVPVRLSNFGRVEPYTTISVKAQVSGELQRIWFKEGDLVEKDQVLYTIDPRPYDVALQQAEANLAKAEAQTEQARANLERDKAQAANAQRELERDEPLLPKNMVSQEEYDTARANAEALKAAVSADEAAVKSADYATRSAKAAIEDAKLQLGYCTIRSPINGKTGSTIIDQGNLVKANDTTPLVVINQIMPIYVSFTLPEGDLSQVRQHMAQGRLEVLALIPGEEDRPVKGELTFIDNTVNQTTGTFRLKATFPNEDGQLWPGLYVNVELQVTVESNAVVMPTEAVQTGQSGSYVYVVKPDMTVELRNVVLGDTQDATVVVKEGLSPGETVVTTGQMRLTPGAAVQVMTEPSPQEVEATPQ